MATEEEQEEEEQVEEGFSEAAKAILTYLNETAGKSFRLSKTSLKPIEARLRENFSQEELRRVVDHKVKTWGPDPKMQEYLRPQTLFQASKFESYLQGAPRPAASYHADFVQCPECGAAVLAGETVCQVCKASIEEVSA